MSKKNQKTEVICGDYFAEVKKIMKLSKKMFLHKISNWKKWKAQVTTSTKKGHFSVLALGVNAEPRKFSLALDYLSHPTFIKLLEEAEREFGYYQQGVIVIPCEASEIQRLLLRGDCHTMLQYIGVKNCVQLNETSENKYKRV